MSKETREAGQEAIEELGLTHEEIRPLTNYTKNPLPNDVTATVTLPDKENTLARPTGSARGLLAIRLTQQRLLECTKRRKE